MIPKNGGEQSGNIAVLNVSENFSSCVSFYPQDGGIEGDRKSLRILNTLKIILFDSNTLEEFNKQGEDTN